MLANSSKVKDPKGLNVNRKERNKKAETNDLYVNRKERYK